MSYCLAVIQAAVEAAKKRVSRQHATAEIGQGAS
jgi:hypothetical protein